MKTLVALKKSIFVCSYVLLICTSITCFAEEKLVFSVDLVRHGDRTPTKEIPSSPYAWKHGAGELTSEGMSQEYQLGLALRKRYIDQYHLLPVQYNAESIYVRSTDMNRTIMSAQSLLLGLYPLGTGLKLMDSDEFSLPQGFQPIPVHTVSIEQDKLLAVKPSGNIFAIASLYRLRQEAWKKKSILFQDKIKKWQHATGIEIKNFSQLIQLGDNLYIRELHHVPLPKGITPDDAKLIIAISQWAVVTFYQQAEMTYPMGHQFLLTIATYLQDAINNKSPLKYVLFSGHDSSIMAVMNTLGVPSTVIPDYASDLNFSLWENANQYYVTVSLNKQPLSISQCGGSVCTVSQFLKLSGI